MSTTYLSVYDLLRITYTYESQAIEAECQHHPQQNCLDSQISTCSTPEICMHAAESKSSSSTYAALETDFTAVYARKKRDSCVSMT
ncbi:hypothetical protein DM02DRAFT_438175 [Periconia macrospinosa]|uniref:Uncharacterized protein n=1 Tax=Periconia macrospinosa TaxID=97972 RepID=A0A2V1DNP4_9PLEO|nr:hypothetical protein DM02DRAFT_438175 [Periconia macrospinosa]